MINRFLGFVSVIVVNLGFSAALNASPAKVGVCHKNPNGFRLISVSENAVQTHLDKGGQLPSTYYIDADGDGYGSTEITTPCPAVGFVSNNTDSNDSDASVHESSQRCH